MTFYGYFRSSAAHRCRIAFHLKGIDPDFVSLHLRRGDQRAEDFLAVNPQGLVPAVTVEGGVLTQSLAIIEWLDETHPEPPLLPAGPMERAQVRAFAQVIACDIHPLQNLRVLRTLKRDFGADQAALDAWCRTWVGAGLETCEAMLARRPEAAFAFGPRPGLAEICLVPQMLSAERFGLDLGPFPRLRRVRAACAVLPAFSEAEPDVQSDAEGTPPM